MQYHVAKNGQKAGPFSQEEVYRRLVSGELSGTDLGWHEGLADWRPLMDLLPPPQAHGLPDAGPVFVTPQGQSSSHGSTPSQTSALAITSLVCGILSFFTGGLASVPAIVTGHIALSRIKRSQGMLGGRGLSVAGLVTGYLGVCLLFLMVFAIGMGISAAGGTIDLAKKTRVASDIQAIRLALASYESRATSLPTTEQGLQALVEKPTAPPIPENYRAFMKEIPRDPWGREYRYRIPAQKAHDTYDLYSVGPDGTDGTEDDIGNW